MYAHVQLRMRPRARTRTTVCNWNAENDVETLLYRIYGNNCACAEKMILEARLMLDK